MHHKHHIIPKHMGGSDDPNNLVELTIEQHAEAHRILFEQYGHWQDELAWLSLSKQIDVSEARIRAVRYTLSGKPKSEDHKRKLSESQKERHKRNKRLGKVKSKSKPYRFSEEASLKRAIINKRIHTGNSYALGIKRSTETKQKMAIAQQKRQQRRRAELQSSESQIL